MDVIHVQYLYEQIHKNVFKICCFVMGCYLKPTYSTGEDKVRLFYLIKCVFLYKYGCHKNSVHIHLIK